MFLIIIILKYLVQENMQHIVKDLEVWKTLNSVHATRRDCPKLSRKIKKERSSLKNIAEEEEEIEFDDSSDQNAIMSNYATYAEIEIVANKISLKRKRRRK